LWLNIFADNKSLEKITKGAIYRHPNMSNNNMHNFIDSLANCIKKINAGKGKFYVLVDLNIDISLNKRTVSCLDYIDHLISYGSVPIITIPTHVTETSSTILDHIVNNDASYTIKPGVIRCDKSLSDHYAIFCVVKGYPTRSQEKTYLTVRDKTKFDLNLYSDEMCETVSQFLAKLEDLNERNFDRNFHAFVTLIQKVIDKHAPLKRLTCNQQKLKNNPWISKGIYVSIRCKKRMHKTHYIHGDETMKQEYKKYVNKLTKIKSIAKKKYYADELSKNKSNPRKT